MNNSTLTYLLTNIIRKMKKIFTLAFALFAFMMASNAQTYLLNEGFEDPNMSLPTGWTIIDNDGDGYNWFVLNNSQSSSGSYNVHSGDGHITSASYVSGTVLTPDNWLITPQLNLTSNSILSFWAAGQDATYYAEFFSVYVATSPTVSAFTATTAVATGTVTATMTQYVVDLSAYTGQQVYIAFRHHNISDMFRLNLDDIQVMTAPTTPTLLVNDSILDFGSVVMGQEVEQQLVVSSYNLTDSITATTAAPFSVSANGTTFGTTATLAPNGGTLYVKYSPTTVGVANGTVVLSNTAVSNVTVAVSGNALDCGNNVLPYTCDFTNDTQNLCWTIEDANNDGSTFTIASDYGYAYYIYNSSNAANDWLISPEFTFTGNEMGSFDYWAYSSSYPEKFMVYAIGASDTVLLVDTVTATNTSPLTQYFALSDLNGDYKIAIRCTSDADKWIFIVSNFSLFTTAVNLSFDPASLDFGVIPVSSTNVLTSDLTILNADTAITIETAAPYAISLDGTTFSTSVTIPTPSNSVESQTIYVQYAPTTAGNSTGMVIATLGNTADTISLVGSAINCDVITTFPFLETFDPSSETRSCWIIIDANNDGNTVQYLQYDDQNPGVAAYMYSSTSNAEEWLISPEITIQSNVNMMYDYSCASSSYPEKYSVWVIPQGGSVETAINLLPTQTISTPGVTSQVIELGAYANQTVRIAFKYESNADMYWFFIDNVKLDFGLGISDMEQNVSVYPNPATSVLNVTADANIETVEVMNLMGQTIQSVNANDMNAQVDVANLSNGVYMLRIHTENGIVNKKFTVAR